MKTKIIPFDLETAKKIQAGEIEGRVMSHNAEARIIDLDMYFQGKKCICAQILGNSGKYITNLYSTDGTDADFIVGYGLYIELQYSDNEPQFKPFDKVLVRRPDKTELCAPNSAWLPGIFQYKSVNSDLYFVSGKAYKDCIPYEGNECLVGTTATPR